MKKEIRPFFFFTNEKHFHFSFFFSSFSHPQNPILLPAGAASLSFLMLVLTRSCGRPTLVRTRALRVRPRPHFLARIDASREAIEGEEEAADEGQSREERRRSRL